MGKKPEIAADTAEVKPPVRSAFGANPAFRRRRMSPPHGQKPLDATAIQEMVEKFLKTNSIKKEPTRYADGAVATSGDYDFGTF